ncbi:ATP-dependent DNA helicase DinG [Salsuginibacillus kocurii]|uniref:ATP-dependent DNA helicase DinG n=1 Tax=Salsuginibacillus kocurii TaxID=427078 RepID=UPI00037E69EF|nr:ATP-dependent DNA helicase DinG [Salsuginibacillus kocurii]
MKRRYVVLDFETTGNAPKKGDRVFQIGACVVENDEVISTYQTMVNPKEPIPYFIEQLTGISDEEVKDAPDFSEICSELLTMLDGSVLVAHNVNFDLGFLNAELDRAGYSHFQGPVIDTVECARIFYPTAEGYRLNLLADWLGFSHERPHQADSDAFVTAKLLIAIKEKMYNLPLVTLQRLEDLLKNLKSDLLPILSDIILHRLKGWKRTVDDKYDVYRNIALKKVDEEGLQQTQAKEEDISRDPYFFENGGSLSEQILHFEERLGQKKMAGKIDAALANHEHLLVEAGTGSGKTLAYLEPVSWYAWQENKPVIVATETIPLQEQIMKQELPLLDKSLPFSLRRTILKGRSHYLCLQKFEAALTQTPALIEEQLTLAQLLVWVTETNFGDVEELNLPGGANRLWDEVKSDPSSCATPQCPWFSRCFYQRAKQDAKDAHVVITNHALLFTDLIQDHPILPAYSTLIIDEAHQLEATAGRHLGLQTDYMKVTKWFSRLLGSSEQVGILDRLLKEDKQQSSFSKLWVEERKQGAEEIRQEWDDLFRMLHDRCRKQAKNHSETGRLSVRFDPSDQSDALMNAIRENVDRLVMHLFEETRAYQPLVQMDKEQNSRTGAIAEVREIWTNLEEEVLVLKQLLLESDPDYVYWMESEKKGALNATYLYARPIDVSSILADQLFAKKSSVILTSATLTVKGSFSYVESRLGLRDFGPGELTIPSPFNYQEQARLYIPNDMPSIKDKDEDLFIYRVAEFIHLAAESMQGRVLVLFTSFDMLNKTNKQLKIFQEEGHYVLVTQGVLSGSRSRLLKTFKQHESAVLLGTSTFWEGIDLPGEEVQSLVIVRLPFSPPGEPVIKAKMERLEEEGANPFGALSLPQAILRFKQGFGRLIRRGDDKGVVFVLDRRLKEARYGKDFLKSLPDVPTENCSTDEALHAATEFLSKKKFH